MFDIVKYFSNLLSSKLAFEDNKILEIFLNYSEIFDFYLGMDV